MPPLYRTALLTRTAIVETVGIKKNADFVRLSANAWCSQQELHLIFRRLPAAYRHYCGDTEGKSERRKSTWKMDE